MNTTLDTTLDAPREAPAHKKYVLDVVHRRESGWTFQEIAKDLGYTRMNACHAYARWRRWALETYPEIKQRPLPRPRTAGSPALAVA